MDKITFLVILSAALIALDLYNFYGFNSLTKMVKLTQSIYLGLSFFSYASLIFLMFSNNNGGEFSISESTNLLIGFVFSVFVFKILFAGGLILHDGGRVIIAGIQYVKGALGYFDESQVFLPMRNASLTMFGLVVAIIPFISMIYGITKGKYQYTVHKIEIKLPHLPEIFDGFKIVQISDIHSGSFDSKDKVLLGIDMINDLQPDIVCFTGDLVNSEKDEIIPFIDLFASIKARDGKYAVLGNHDYVGIYRSSNPQLYTADLFRYFEMMGFELLNNEHRILTKDGESLNLIGVENWGESRWFPKEGDIEKATEGLSSDAVNILLSHDPTHWGNIVKELPFHVDLTLSGHTHGFQFGVKWANFEWSPASLRYKHWAGLYREGSKYLYVNRGFGFLGFPGRVGMWPEITEITLKKDLSAL